MEYFSRCLQSYAVNFGSTVKVWDREKKISRREGSSSPLSSSSISPRL